MTSEIELAGPGNAEPDSLTFIGTATVLLRLAGFTVLTDPNFLHRGAHAKLGYGLRSRRLTEPAMTIAALPSVDFVVLSHHHGDHFDEVAEAELPKHLPIVTEPGSARKLRRQGFTSAMSLPTWERCTFRRGDRSVAITAVPAKHAPQPLQTLLPKVMGSVLEVSEGGELRHRIHITGDTLYHDGLEAIAHRYPDVDVCIIHLGGTRIAGVLLTMDAEQGVRALRLLRPRSAVPVHYDDYTVFKSPLADFEAAVASASLPTEIRYLRRGETIPLPARPQRA